MISINAMFPVLVTPELEALKGFYGEHFGMQSVFFDPSFYLHLLHPASKGQLGFLVPDHPSQPEYLQDSMRPIGHVISFEVDDANAAFDYARTAQLDRVMDLREEPWGQRHFIVRDPAGFHVDVVQHLDNTL